MSRQGSRRVMAFSPGVTETMVASVHTSPRQREGDRRGGVHYKVPEAAATTSPATWSSRSATAHGFIPSHGPGGRNSARSTPGGRCYRCVKTGVAAVVRFFRMRRRTTRRSRRWWWWWWFGASPAKVSAVSHAHGYYYASPYDSHYSEAIEDCIQFINTSYKKDLC